LEQKELYDRVDDAVCAVRSALEEGILPGAGKALFEESFIEVDRSIDEHNVAHQIVTEALQAPFMQILLNAGLNPVDIYGNNPMVIGVGYNLKTGQMGDLVKMGVIDPLKVTRSALQNAISVAVTILSTNAIVTMARSYEQSED
jgi:chaperonin GroEL